MGKTSYKHLSNLMLLAAFVSSMFYSMSYPYIYAETIKVVPRLYISLENILTCLSVIAFCGLWNKYSDRLFVHYRKLLFLEIAADIYLFADVIIRGNLNFYFLLNVLIYCLITRNLACGGTKMRAKVNPTDTERERFDNNSNIVNSASTIIGTGLAILFDKIINGGIPLNALFILALIGNTSDNIFYIHIYNKITKEN